MNETKIADVIVPEIFTPYVIEKTAEKSVLLTSGIATNSEKLNQLVNQGGVTIQMPFWKDLQGDDEVLSDQRALEPGKITSGVDIAALLLRGKAWAANDLAGALAGDDPMDAIADRVSAYWARREQKILLSVLKGIFKAESMANHILDRKTKGISAEVVLDGKQLLGDAADQLQGIMMHSAVYTELQKQKVIEYKEVVDPNGNTVTIPTYLTYAVVVDDSMPKNGDVYTSYLFARGVVARGAGVPVAQVPTETDRDSLAGVDILINRIAQVVHIYGVKWIGKPANTADSTPANSDLEIGTNWERVYEDKNIGVVAIEHRLTDAA